jgi:O-antigen/teichoic acid export membrane protein
MTDQRTLLSGTAVNVAGLVAGVVAAYGVQVLVGRQLGAGGLGLVTVAVQVAFVAAAGSRFGMDLASVREVAIGVGAGGAGHLRSLVHRCALIAGAASILVAGLVAALSPLTGGNQATVAAAAVSIPFAAVANTYLGATRGLKQMTPTLWVFWIGQPLAWIVAAVVVLAAGGHAEGVVLAYDASWAVAAIAARALWLRASAGMGDLPAGRDVVSAAIRFGLPRAPSALLAQALFWIDLWVLDIYAGRAEVGTYAAVSRLAQVILLFLTSVNLLFAPFAADLHARGQRDQLDALFKAATRWALAATLPVAIVLAVAPEQALRAFGPDFTGGGSALRIMLVGQLINVATGSVGFVLIMVGRTGLDLLDNAIGVLLLAALAAPLADSHGMEGAALAAAASFAAVNLLRLAQVRTVVGVQPFDTGYLRLAVPAAGCAAAALLAHAAAGGSSWWADLAATTAAGMLAYLVLLPAGLPAADRSALQRATRRITKRLPR